MKNLTGFVAAALLLAGCAINPPQGSGEQFESIANGTAQKSYAQFKPDEARMVDVYSPILKARENGAARVSGIPISSTNQAAIPAVAGALRTAKALTDDVLFTGLLMSGPADCQSCKNLNITVNDARNSILMPSIGYSKTVSTGATTLFGTAAVPLLDEIDNAMKFRNCMPVLGNDKYGAYKPSSDSNNYFIGRYVCPLPQVMAESTKLGKIGVGSPASMILGDDHKWPGLPNLIQTFAIHRDKEVPSTLHVAVTSNCAAMVMFAKARSSDIKRGDADICKTMTLPLDKANGWTTLTTQIAVEKNYTSEIVIDGPEWSGTVASPFQSQKYIENIYKP